MRDPHRRNYRWSSVVSVAVTLLATLQLPNTAGTSTAEPIPNPKFDPLHRLEMQGKTRGSKVNFGGFDAWVAKYQVAPDGATKVLWKRQLGSSFIDSSWGVATDSKGNVLITGYTEGSVGGTNKGFTDAWVAKYGPGGALQWKQQLGSSVNDYSYGIATDSKGNVFITGSTDGALGGTSKGFRDAWVAKYSPGGTLLWTKQLGTSEYEESRGVATDSKGNVLITGYTEGSLGGTNKTGADAWVAKYSPGGFLKWKRQLGSSDNESSLGVATDSKGNIFISGYTGGSLGGTNRGSYDAWVAKYSPGGFLKWKRQLGSSAYEESRGVTTDSNGNVFIAGRTDGALRGTSNGSIDAWVAKYSPGGTLLWTKQLGTSEYDDSRDVATDSKGNVFIAGYTEGSLGGVQRGESDAWVAQFNPQGKQLWLRQDGTTRVDRAWGIAVDSSDFVITTGETLGNFSRD
ncbi:MAG TPA: SBBP repeat-containing protein [Stenomitos sp.]